MRMILAAAVLAAGPAAAQQGDCARLAEALAEDRLPALWEDEAEQMAEIAEEGREGACLAAFDLIRPSPPTGPADLPQVCVELREILAEDGLPGVAEAGLPEMTTAIGEGDAEGCTRGLQALGVGGG